MPATCMCAIIMMILMASCLPLVTFFDDVWQVICIMTNLMNSKYLSLIAIVIYCKQAFE